MEKNFKSALGMKPQAGGFSPALLTRSVLPRPSAPLTGLPPNTTTKILLPPFTLSVPNKPIVLEQLFLAPVISPSTPSPSPPQTAPGSLSSSKTATPTPSPAH